MRLDSLYIASFGKFHQYELSFGDGLNLVYGLNESGKTTIIRFIEAIFYGFYKPYLKTRQYEDHYEHYFPWHHAGYGGRIDLYKDGCLYRVERHLIKGKERVKVIDLDRGEDISHTMPYNKTYKEIDPAAYFLGISKSLYRNTMTVHQLALETEAEVASEIKDRFHQLSEGNISDLSIDSFLKEIQKELDAIGNEKRKASPYGQLKLLYEDLNTNLKEAMLIGDKIRTYQAQSHEANKCLSEAREALKELKVYEDESLVEAKKHLANKKTNLEDQVASHRVQEKDYRATMATRAQVDIEISHLKQEIGSKDQEAEIIGRQLRLLPTTTYKAVYLGGSMGLGALGLGMVAYAFITGKSIGLGMVLSLLGVFISLGLVFLRRHDGHTLRNRIMLTDEIAQVSDQKKALMDRLETLQSHIGQDVKEEKDMNLDLSRFEAELDKLNLLETQLEEGYIPEPFRPSGYLEKLHEKDRLEKACQALEIETTRLREAIDMIGSSQKSVASLQEEMASVVKDLEAFDHRIGVLTLMAEGMVTVSNQMREAFTPKVTKAFRDHLSLLSRGKYVDVRVNQDLDILVVDPVGGLSLPLSSLSGGTLDLIYMALRLALLDTINSDQNLPLILDDPYVQIDDMRMRGGMACLGGLKRQVLLFTCHERELKLVGEGHFEGHILRL